MSFFFFNDTATTEIYTLSLHDALPILCADHRHPWRAKAAASSSPIGTPSTVPRMIKRRPPVVNIAKDRKSTRLNSSHANISYAVFCLKKKKKKTPNVKTLIELTS